MITQTGTVMAIDNSEVDIGADIEEIIEGDLEITMIATMVHSARTKIIKTLTTNMRLIHRRE